MLLYYLRSRYLSKKCCFWRMCVVCVGESARAVSLPSCALLTVASQACTHLGNCECVSRVLQTRVFFYFFPTDFPFHHACFCLFTAIAVVARAVCSAAPCPSWAFETELYLLCRTYILTKYRSALLSHRHGMIDKSSIVIQQ